MPVLALDAMGVLYSVADDVGELLIPFVREKGGIGDAAAIEIFYRRASLGLISAADFWQSVGLPPSVENQYLERHQLSAGVPEFLEKATQVFGKLCCISNDVPEWSRSLRRQFGLDKIIPDWIISGDVGLRKPDLGIFNLALKRLDVPASEITFVDDRPRNVAAAFEAGFNVILFGPQSSRLGLWEHFETLESLAASWESPSEEVRLFF